MSLSLGEMELWREILPSCPQLAMTLSGIKNAGTGMIENSAVDDAAMRIELKLRVGSEL